MEANDSVLIGSDSATSPVEVCSWLSVVGCGLSVILLVLTAFSTSVTDAVSPVVTEVSPLELSELSDAVSPVVTVAVGVVEETVSEDKSAKTKPAGVVAKSIENISIPASFFLKFFIVLNLWSLKSF